MSLFGLLGKTMKKLIVFYSIILLSWINQLSCQVEHIPIYHPVYRFLLHCETKGLLPNFSLSSLPLQKKEIVDALKKIRSDSSLNSSSDIAILDAFEMEFNIKKRENAVLFYSKSDSIQLIPEKLFTNDEKFIYHYIDETSECSLVPLVSWDNIFNIISNNLDNVGLGNLGIRLNGTIDNKLGYFLKITNGQILYGNRNLAFKDNRLRYNVKFSELNSDFDFSESHIRLDLDWFYAFTGRENRLLGAGINQYVFLSDNAPPFDAIGLGVQSKTFEYRFTFGSLIALNESCVPNGKDAIIPPKYISMHRFAFKPSWGELALWENVIYSNRNPDLAYLIPLSFLKNIEHTLHDRDNTMLGFDITVRPLSGIQLKGSFLLDDVVFSEIGKGFWHNKFAWNIAMILSLPLSFDIAFEYSRVEPFTFSHFNNQNSMTNDSLIFGGYLKPNSDQFAMNLFWFYGARYPLELKLTYTRHGDNIKDKNGNVIKNVGGDPLLSKRSEDAYYYTFLDGDRTDILDFQINAGLQIVRGIDLMLKIDLSKSSKSDLETGFRITISIGNPNDY